MITADLTNSTSARVLMNHYHEHLAHLLQRKSHLIPKTFCFNRTDNTIISYTSDGYKISTLRKTTWSPPYN